MLNLHRYGKGLPIVCLHGWGFDHSIWQCLETIWPDEWQMITVDLPGHGQTSSMSMRKFTAKLLDELPPVFAIIGWSLGGLYAFDLTKKAGARVRHLTAIASSPCFIKQPNWPGVEPAILTRFYRRYVRDPFKTVRDFIELQFINQNNEHSTEYSPMLPTDAQLGLRLLKFSDFRSEMLSIQCNISFMVGQQDSIVPVSVADALTNQLGIGDVSVINQCGHMPFLTHSQLLINHLSERLR